MNPRRESFNKKFMVVGVMTGKGTLILIKVPEKVKISSEYCIQHVLKPIPEVGIPKLYGMDTSKVFLHRDAAPSHTSNKTAQYSAEVKRKFGISIIPRSDIPVKCLASVPWTFLDLAI